MRRWNLGLLLVVFVQGVVAGAALGGRDTAPKGWALNANDGFLVAGTRIGCEVKSSPNKGQHFNALLCFERVSTAPQPKAFQPKPGTYVLVVNELSVFVILNRKGVTKPAFSVRQPSALGFPTPLIAQTGPLPAHFGTLRPGRFVYLVGTHNACSIERASLVCFEYDRSGPVARSYSSVISDKSVFVAREGAGRRTLVFSGSQNSG